MNQYIISILSQYIESVYYHELCYLMIFMKINNINIVYFTSKELYLLLSNIKLLKTQTDINILVLFFKIDIIVINCIYQVYI